MKKRILVFALLALAICCMLAISVSAQNRTSISYTDASDVTHNVPVVKYEDATAESVIAAIKAGDNRGHICSVSGTQRVMDNGAYVIVMDTDGNLTAYPSWYILDITGDQNSAQVYEVGYGYLNSVFGKTYKDGATRYIEFPEGLTALRNNGVWGRNTLYEPNLTEIVIPSTVTTIAGNALSFSANLKKVHIGDDNNITTIGDDTMYNS